MTRHELQPPVAAFIDTLIKTPHDYNLPYQNNAHYISTRTFLESTMELNLEDGEKLYPLSLNSPHIFINIPTNRLSKKTTLDEVTHTSNSYFIGNHREWSGIRLNHAYIESISSGKGGGEIHLYSITNNVKRLCLSISPKQHDTSFCFTDILTIPLLTTNAMNLTLTSLDTQDEDSISEPSALIALCILSIDVLGGLPTTILSAINATIPSSHYQTYPNYDTAIQLPHPINPSTETKNPDQNDPPTRKTSPIHTEQESNAAKNASDQKQNLDAIATMPTREHIRNITDQLLIELYNKLHDPKKPIQEILQRFYKILSEYLQAINPEKIIQQKQLITPAFIKLVERHRETIQQSPATKNTALSIAAILNLQSSKIESVLNYSLNSASIDSNPNLFFSINGNPAAEIKTTDSQQTINEIIIQIQSNLIFPALSTIGKLSTISTTNKRLILKNITAALKKTSRATQLAIYQQFDNALSKIESKYYTQSASRY